MILAEPVFLSIQGEGPDSGKSMVFVRAKNCNLSCRYCDSKYTWGNEGEVITIDMLISQILNEDKHNCGRVYFTGGEPLLSRDIYGLVQKIKKLNYSITIATNGTIKRPRWWYDVLWDVDCKCPSSGVKDIFNISWGCIGRKNRVKFVVSDEEDLKFVTDKVYELRKSPLCPTLLVSPMIPTNEDVILKPWLQRVWQFCTENNLRFSFQVHKIVWGNRKGV